VISPVIDPYLYAEELSHRQATNIDSGHPLDRWLPCRLERQSNISKRLTTRMAQIHLLDFLWFVVNTIILSGESFQDAVVSQSFNQQPSRSFLTFDIGLACLRAVLTCRLPLARNHFSFSSLPLRADRIVASPPCSGTQLFGTLYLPDSVVTTGQKRLLDCSCSASLLHCSRVPLSMDPIIYI